MKKRTAFNTLIKYLMPAVLLASVGLVSQTMPVMAADVNVTATPPGLVVEKIVFTTPPRTIVTSMPTQVMTVQTQNAGGNPVNVTTDTTINLTSTSANGLFSLNDAPWVSITSVTIPNGSNSASFYYKDPVVGNPVTTASESPDQGWTDAEQQQSIISSGGGSGGEQKTPPAPEVNVTVDGESTKYSISNEGELLETVEVTLENGMVSLTIDKGTIARAKNGNRLENISITVDENPPAPPEGANIIGLVFNLEPSGANFAPPPTLTYTYDPSQIPDDVDENDLVLAYYNEESGEWVELDCIVDTENNTITASISHFTDFALIAPPVPKSPLSAAFEVSHLTIIPAQAEPGEEITISVTVGNSSGVVSDYTIILKIDDLIEATEQVRVSPDNELTVDFSVTRDVIGSYQVEVNGLTGKFDIAVPPSTPLPPLVKHINWSVLGGIIAAVVTGGISIVLLIIRRKRKMYRAL
jgi:hypothetical protein